MCRRELDKAESEIKKNSSIIGDYKQVSTTPWWCGLLSKYKTFRYFRRFLEINVICAMHLRRQLSCSKQEACGWFCIVFGRDPEVVSPVCCWLWVFVDQQSPQPQSQTNLVQMGSWTSKVHLMPKKVLSYLPFVNQMHRRNKRKGCLFPFKALLWHSSSWSQGIKGANSCVSLVGP